MELAKHHFELPPGVDPSSKEWLFPNKFSVGYRHMVRFFTVGIWEVASGLGYQFVMRLDDDAFVLSPIRYNIFAFMARRKLEYGFRLTSWEHGEPAQRGEFHQFVREYAINKGVSPHWGLADSCPDKSLERFTPERCGQVYTIYNNFFVANVSFWRRPDVQAFVKHVDASKTIYYKRWGDALWHSVALQLFLPRERVHMFDDFAYEHTSRKIYFYRGKPVVCFPVGRHRAAKRAQAGPDGDRPRACAHGHQHVQPLARRHQPLQLGAQGERPAARRLYGDGDARGARGAPELLPAVARREGDRAQRLLQRRRIGGSEFAAALLHTAQEAAQHERGEPVWR